MFGNHCPRRKISGDCTATTASAVSSRWVPSSKENNHKQMNILCALMGKRVTQSPAEWHTCVVLGFGWLVIFGKERFFRLARRGKCRDGVYNAIKESRNTSTRPRARSTNSILFNLKTKYAKLPANDGKWISSWKGLGLAIWNNISLSCGCRVDDDDDVVFGRKLFWFFLALLTSGSPRLVS